MSRIAIVTDSNSGITQSQAEKMGVYVLPMPFFIDGEMYLEEISLSQEEFYKKLTQDADISTSQPSPGDVMDLWTKLLEIYDEVVHIPMSSGLSASMENAAGLALQFNGRVFVVDNQRISVTQYQSVVDAQNMALEGKSGAEIKAELERMKLEASIYITVENLKYLKKGGRITPAAAAVGTILNVKPVLQIQGEKLDAFAKVRGKHKARKVMLEAMKKDFDTRFSNAIQNGEMRLLAAYTGNYEEALSWKEEIEDTFQGMECMMHPLSLSVACHIGNGALAVACSKKY